MKSFFRKLTVACLSVAMLLTQSVCVSALPENNGGGKLTAPTSISAKSAVLIDADSGDVIFGKDENTRRGPASTTKIVSALVVVSSVSLDEMVTIPPAAVGVEGSSIYLKAGERLSVHDLLYALLLSSANDAAVALALHVSGSVPAFAEKMNELADGLGLENTHFTNPHGLDDEQHYTTALDLARISAEALKNKTLAEIFSTKTTVIPPRERQNDENTQVRRLNNHNKLLSLYDGAIGMKTGFTKKCGRTLVGAAQRDGLTLVSVTLSASDDWNDHTRMLDYGFSLYERVVLYDAYEFSYSYPVVGADEQYITLTNASVLALTRRRADTSVRKSVTSYRHFEFAPIAKGTALATLTLYCGDKSVSSPLVAAGDTAYKKQK